VRILFLDQYGEMGGAQRALLDTLQAVGERGWQAHVLVPEGGPLLADLRSRKVSTGAISCGPYRSGSKSVADSWRFALDLVQQARAIGDLAGRGNFDLIYVNGPRLLPAVALANRGRALVLFHAHSHIPQKPSALLAGWSIRRTAATVAACSNSVLEPLRRYADTGRQHVIPNGVPDFGYRQRVFGRDANWRIGVLGRIAPEKGQAEFVRAAAMLRDELPGVRYVICGAPLFSASSRYADALRDAASGLAVEFAGWREDIGAVLRELDLLVVPSRQEGMGRVVLEAFSAGVPVIAFPTGGIPEVVLDGETGFLTREASAEALAARIREVIAREPDELRKVAQNARRTWQRSFTVAIYQERIIRLIENLVSAAPAEREIEVLQQRR
jgi:glycosyltransferase involved in cell wall biosynthesis